MPAASRRGCPPRASAWTSAWTSSRRRWRAAGRAGARGVADRDGIAVALLDTVPPGGHPGRAMVAERQGGGYAAFVGRPNSATGLPPCTGSWSRTCLSANQPMSLSSLPTPTGPGTTPGRTARRASWSRAPRPCGRRGLSRRRSRRWRSQAPMTGSCLKPRGSATACPGRCPPPSRFPCRGLPGHRAVRILQSVQAVDAGTVLNPVQLRGQVEGGVAQALGAALFEEVTIAADGVVTTRALREYHVPVLATCHGPRCFSPRPPVTRTGRTGRSR